MYKKETIQRRNRHVRKLIKLSNEKGYFTPSEIGRIIGEKASRVYAWINWINVPSPEEDIILAIEIMKEAPLSNHFVSESRKAELEQNGQLNLRVINEHLVPKVDGPWSRTTPASEIRQKHELKQGVNDEIGAIAKIAEVFEPLNADEQRRVLNWTISRYRVGGD